MSFDDGLKLICDVLYREYCNEFNCFFLFKIFLIFKVFLINSFLLFVKIFL